ncbi:hypothetical protein ACFFX1_10290 [Dactylosporangium sucinum]|uniref:hypothetical protein n=1 Tax=Dactylosporangium sucinum TaxID=1424081 RepID=UPI00167EFF6D|nr:hypothetical protein [Dactylosporangium sucinum]
MDAWLRRRYLDDRAPVRQLAADLAVTPTTIYRWLHAAGITLRRSTPTLSATWLDEQLTAGLSINEIAKLAKVSRSSVWDQLSAHGLLDVADEPGASQAETLYREGAPMAAIGERLQVGRRRVRGWLNARHVPIQRPGGRAATDHPTGRHTASDQPLYGPPLDQHRRRPVAPDDQHDARPPWLSS